jgi:hypothetical protein
MGKGTEEGGVRLGTSRGGGEGGGGASSARHEAPGTSPGTVVLCSRRRNRGGQSPTGAAPATIMGGDGFV